MDKPTEIANALDDMDLESVRGALDELFLLARHYRKSDKFRELMQFVASFKRYSAFNAMLVHVQMPGARFVLPAKRWIEGYGRWPKHDAQPLVMLQPMTPIMFGFDVSQTEGKALPKGFENPFEPNGEISKDEFQLTVSNAELDGIEVNCIPLGSTMGGYIRNAASPNHVVGVIGPRQLAFPRRAIRVNGEERPLIAQVRLNSNLPLTTNYETLVHELGHLYCGHVGTPDPRWWPDRRNPDKNTKEFEAEAVSYLVCRRASLDTPAIEYLHDYLSANAEVPPISLETVFKAAQRIESMRKKRSKARKLQGEGV